jgi:hypothetical protein
MMPDETLCPSHLRESLNEYVLRGRETGGFLRFVLENNLQGAISNADHANLRLLPHIVAWVHDNVPSNTWGSPEKVRAHLVKKRKEMFGAASKATL